MPIKTSRGVAGTNDAFMATSDESAPAINQTVLMSQGYQCQVVDYHDHSSLIHALMGVDTVISTVTGKPQLRLIEAAVQCRVRRFAPAEFEGQPGQRVPNSILDRGKGRALARLQQYATYMQSTVFVCGILYERFAVGGLRAYQMGANLANAEGEYIADIRNMTAVAPAYDAANNMSYLCLTSIHDVAKFVVRSLDMPHWPAEMSMCSERISVNALIELIKTCRGRPLHPIEWQNPAGLRYQLSIAEANRYATQQQRIEAHLATAEGRYDFATPGYLNCMARGRSFGFEAPKRPTSSNAPFSGIVTPPNAGEMRLKPTETPCKSDEFCKTSPSDDARTHRFMVDTSLNMVSSQQGYAPTAVDMKANPSTVDEVKSNLPLPEQPPVASDFNSSDARTVNVGSGGQAADISSAGAAGREGKDGLSGLPNDAVTRDQKDHSGLANTTK
ncbi:hypothetical protein OPT61_g1 [Boeremia exigua]|uniref:Uncharacterized protein n=1 Tax=Boeremia exigua TaxID=749465 RepID=A0ACC2IVD9_9PLEO|nr:hypothetical protein OPT61_g1 [Boeremia exigua]